MLKDKYELVSKAERDRIIDNSFIGSYGPFPVHNVKYNKLIQYLEKINNNSRVSDESEYQKALKDTIKMQLNLSRLKILNDYALKEKKTGFGSDVLAGLSFRNWCGLGTPIYDNIKNDLDDPNRMFAIDRICRDHDIRYTKSQTQEEMNEADNIMMKEIFNEYVVNFNRNFLTGNYKTDFTTWTSSFKTVFNYLMTGIETAYVGKLTQATLKTAYNVLKLPYDYIVASNPLLEYDVGYFKGMSKMVSELGDIESQGEPYVESVVNMFKEAYMHRPQREIPSKLQMLKMRLKSGVSTLALTFVASSLIKDRIFALGSLAAMTLKKGFEFLTGYQVADLTKHEVSDEDLENIIKVFETLQNQYLQESGLDPIKIGNEWKKDEIEVPPIKEIEEDIKIIAEQNKTYNELNKTMVEAIPEPIVEPIQELEPEPTQVYNYEPLTEEELKRLKVYEELNDYFDKLLSETNLITSPYPDLPSSEPIITTEVKPEETVPIDENLQQNKEINLNENDVKDKIEL